MIRPDGFRGAAFGTVAAGDARYDRQSRRAVSKALGISSHWATVTQVHGARVVEAESAGALGEADAIFTLGTGLPLSIATADCVPVIIEGAEVAAVVHVGWRGAAAGVVDEVLSALDARGATPERAAIGPAIGPCCYEVGDEVAGQIPGHASRTSWGSVSVDLAGFVAERLSPLRTWRSDRCTYTAADLYSYRRDRTRKRQVAVAWLPDNSQ